MAKLTEARWGAWYARRVRPLLPVRLAEGGWAWLRPVWQFDTVWGDEPFFSHTLPRVFIDGEGWREFHELITGEPYWRFVQRAASEGDDNE